MNFKSVFSAAFPIVQRMKGNKHRKWNWTDFRTSRSEERSKRDFRVSKMCLDYVQFSVSQCCLSMWVTMGTSTLIWLDNVKVVNFRKVLELISASFSFVFPCSTSPIWPRWLLDGDGGFIFLKATFFLFHHRNSRTSNNTDVSNKGKSPESFPPPGVDLGLHSVPLTME